MSSYNQNIGINTEICAHLEPGFAGLTKAELETFEFAAVGLTREEIAALKHRSGSTVNSQLESSLSKIGVHKVSVAVAMLCADGKLTFESIAKGVRQALIAAFMLVPVANAFSLEPVDMRRPPHSVSARSTKLIRREFAL